MEVELIKIYIVVAMAIILILDSPRAVSSGALLVLDIVWLVVYIICLLFAFLA